MDKRVDSSKFPRQNWLIEAVVVAMAHDVWYLVQHPWLHLAVPITTSRSQRQITFFFEFYYLLCFCDLFTDTRNVKNHIAYLSTTQLLNQHGVHFQKVKREKCKKKLLTDWRLINIMKNRKKRIWIKLPRASTLWFIFTRTACACWKHLFLIFAFSSLAYRNPKVVYR